MQPNAAAIAAGLDMPKAAAALAQHTDWLRFALAGNLQEYEMQVGAVLADLLC